MKFAKKNNLIIYTKYSELCKIIKKSNKFTDIDYVQYTVHREVSVCAAVSTRLLKILHCISWHIISKITLSKNTILCI